MEQFRGSSAASTTHYPPCNVHRCDLQCPLDVDSGHPLGVRGGVRPALIEAISRQISIPKRLHFEMAARLAAGHEYASDCHLTPSRSQGRETLVTRRVF